MTEWAYNGVKGAADFPPPPLVAAFSGPVIVAGSGRSLWQDLDTADHHPDFAGAAVIAVNTAGQHFPRPFQHWATIEGSLMGAWLTIRRREHSEPHVFTHSVAAAIGIENVWHLEEAPGCSGAFAALIALALGYERVALAGVPEDNAGHFYDPPGDAGTYSNAGAQIQWESLRDRVFGERVKSFSGLTRVLLGAPR